MACPLRSSVVPRSWGITLLARSNGSYKNHNI